MKKLIISSLAIAAIASCSSSNDAATDNRDYATLDGPFLVTKFTETTNSQSNVTEYKYNGDKIAEEKNTTKNRKIVYTYTGDNIVKTEEYLGTVLVGTREFTYTNDKVSSEKVTNTIQDITYTINYQYISDTQVKFNKYEGASFDDAGNYTVKYSNVDATLTAASNVTTSGNLASTSYTYNGVTYKATNTFDSNNNPMKNVKGWLKINVLQVGEPRYGNSNLVNQIEERTGAATETYKINAVHTLFASSYPSKSVMTYTKPGGVTSTTTYLYEYNK